MSKLKVLIPLAIFAVIALFLLRGLDKDPRAIPSALVGKPVPQFVLPILSADGAASTTWSPAALKGQVWLLNVWGSWCAACQIEHPVLIELAKSKIVPIVGFAWKDKPEAARAWLAKLGDPYLLNVLDQSGSAAIDLGVYGAPETYVIDQTGMIRHRHVGPVTNDSIAKDILPLLTALKAK
jgi:cytochrome c biogenesis protein CcmG, thiol:disulfide interchange protein DsbE